MARISFVEPQDAPAEVKEVYEGKLKGKPGSIQKVLAHRPEMLKNFLGFYASVGRSLDRRLYELVYGRVSFLNQCFYCSQHHIAAGKRQGLGADDFRALRDGHLERFSEKEQAALRFAEKLTREPWTVADQDFADLRKHFSEAEIVDLDMLAALANLTNRVTGPLNLDLEFPEEKF